MKTEQEIRTNLSDWLLKAYFRDESPTYLYELMVHRPAARLDVVAITKQIHLFEIKGPLDSLSRLKKQIPAYESIGEKINLVVAHKHLNSALKIAPESWGIIVFDDDSFVLKRKPKRNWNNNSSALLHSLSLPEIKTLGTEKSIQVVNGLRKHDLISDISAKVKKTMIQSAVKEVYTRRAA